LNVWIIEPGQVWHGVRVGDGFNIEDK
jgi:hypothetical protein